MDDEEDDDDDHRHHRRGRTGHRQRGRQAALGVAELALVDVTKAVDMELEAGQFFLFNERLLHHSDANRSSPRRMDLSARYTTPFVKLLDQDAPPLFPGHTCVVVSGEDRFGLNRTSLPPR